MTNSASRMIDIRVDHRTLDARKLAELPCHCGSPLSLHQPDPDRPAVLMGSCPDCGDLYFIDASGDAAVEVYRLPCREEFARAILPPSTVAGKRRA